MTTNEILTGNNATQQAAITALGSDVNAITAAIEEIRRIRFNDKLDDGAPLIYKTRLRVEAYLMKLEVARKRLGLTKEGIDALALALTTDRIRRGNPS
jgi:hypothetical protein